MNQPRDDLRQFAIGGLGLALPANGDARDAAQAVELIRALRDQLHAMSHRLVVLECQDAAGATGWASAIRHQAAALRLDISEAQFLIDRLQRRHLNGNGHGRPRLSEQPRPSDRIATRRW